MSTAQQGSLTKYLSAHACDGACVCVCVWENACMVHTQGNQAIEGDLSAHQLRN